MIALANKKKYESCPHARAALLQSSITLVEVTGDPMWGMGLNVTQTLECLPEFWPGQNLMG